MAANMAHGVCVWRQTAMAKSSERKGGIAKISYQHHQAALMAASGGIMKSGRRKAAKWRRRRKRGVSATRENIGEMAKINGRRRIGSSVK